jgi:predicted metal-dependent HD superfamily phosphohydrolase
VQGVAFQRFPKPSRTGVPLTDRWTTDWTGLGAPLPGTATRDLVLARYGEPHRAYHTLQHLEECFSHLERARDLAERPAEVAIAIWFHDAIYDPHAADNEERSADWAASAVKEAGVGEAVAARIRQLILATRHEGEPAAGDATLLVDIDLAILGATQSRFDEYEAQIRREFVWVPEALYRATRSGILRGFLGRTRIYRTERFREWFEAAARSNLERALARLGG